MGLLSPPALVVILTVISLPTACSNIKKDLINDYCEEEIPETYDKAQKATFFNDCKQILKSNVYKHLNEKELKQV